MLAMLSNFTTWHWFTFSEEHMRSFVHRTRRWLKIADQAANGIFRWCNQVNALHGHQWFAFLVDVFDDWKGKFSLNRRQRNSDFQISLVIPSALKSCIFVQAETIRIESLSTTRTLHSTTAALPGGVFFCGPLYLTTSFMISTGERRREHVEFHCCCDRESSNAKKASRR